MGFGEIINDVYISEYDSYVVSDYYIWFLIKRRNFLQFENFQYGLVLSGEVLKEIMLSSMIVNSYLRLIMSYSMVVWYFQRRLRTWRTLVICYGIRIVMDLLTTISREIVSPTLSVSISSCIIYSAF
jgi:hypothetical protein